MTANISKKKKKTISQFNGSFNELGWHKEFLPNSIPSIRKRDLSSLNQSIKDRDSNEFSWCEGISSRETRTSWRINNSESLFS